MGEDGPASIPNYRAIDYPHVGQEIQAYPVIEIGSSNGAVDDVYIFRGIFNGNAILPVSRIYNQVLDDIRIGGRSISRLVLE